MATQVQFRRGTTAETASFTGASGEITVDLTKHVCVVHDAIQVGGYPLMLESGVNSALSLGSLSNCSLKFLNDPNTGFFSPGPDQLSLVTGGVARITIDSAGAVAIPGNLLAGAILQNTVRLQSGTASAPALTFDADTNTGIYSPGADQLAVSTGGAGRLFVDSSGRVGIGTSSPGVRLQVNQAMPNGTNIFSVYPGIVQIYNNQGLANSDTSVKFVHNFSIGDVATGEIGTLKTDYFASLSYRMFFRTGGAERMTIDSSGRVGVGTSSPDSLLTVGGGTNSLGVCTFFNSYSASETGKILFKSNNNFNASLGIASIYASDAGTTNQNRGNLIFATGFDAAPTERLRIDSSGRVGIGTSSPDARLQVNQAIPNGTNTFGVYPGIVQIYNSQGISNSDTSVKFVHNFSIGDVATGEIGTLKTDYFASLSYRMFFRTGGTERMTIDSSGNVGIGTSNPLAKFVLGSSGGYSAGSAADDCQLVVQTANGTSKNGLRIVTNNYGSASSAYLDLVNFGSKNFNVQSGFRITGGVDSGATGTSDPYLSFSTVSLGSDSTTATVALSERMRIDSSGRLLVGTSTARSNFFNVTNVPSQFLIETTGQGVEAAFIRNETDDNGAALILAKSKGSAPGSNTLVASGDNLGEIYFMGNDGSEFVTGASISCVVNGTPGANNMPGGLVFSTTANGSTDSTERMRITSDAYVRLASGTGGIQFNGDTAAANALNDYEEGTWTPIFAGFASVTLTVQAGTYVKTGKLVYIRGVLAYSARTVGSGGAGNVCISNLPFGRDTTVIADNGASIRIYVGGGTKTHAPAFSNTNNYYPSDTNSSFASADPFGASATIYFDMTYTAA